MRGLPVSGLRSDGQVIKAARVLEKFAEASGRCRTGMARKSHWVWTGRERGRQTLGAGDAALNSSRSKQSREEAEPSNSASRSWMLVFIRESEGQRRHPWGHGELENERS